VFHFGSEQVCQEQILPDLVFFAYYLSSASGTNRYFRRVASEFGLKISFVDCSKTKLLEAAITPQTKVTSLAFEFICFSCDVLSPHFSVY
jgi:hypothetical protein